MKNNFESTIFCVLVASCVAMLASMANPHLIYDFGMRPFASDILHRSMQFGLYSILHGGIFHLLSNALFLITIGKIVETYHGSLYVGKLWLFTTLLTGVALIYLSSGVTIGASGFTMALLAVYAYDLRKVQHPDYKGALMWIGLNIALGFVGNISLVGHLFGAISGGIFAWGSDMLRRQNMRR